MGCVCLQSYISKSRSLFLFNPLGEALFHRQIAVNVINIMVILFCVSVKLTKFECTSFNCYGSSSLH